MSFRVYISYAFTAALVAMAAVVSEPEARAEEDSEVSAMRIIDFAATSPTWRSINDGVMGGVSSSRMEINSGVAVFSGTVSLANNGGFASVRSLPGEYDLGRFGGLIVRLCGDGKRYALRLRTTDAFDGVSYQAMLQPPANQWQEIVVPFDSFEPVFRGRRVDDYPPLDPKDVRTFGLLVSDKQEGPFRLEIAWIGGATSTTDGVHDDP